MHQQLQHCTCTRPDHLSLHSRSGDGNDHLRGNVIWCDATQLIDADLRTYRHNANVSARSLVSSEGAYNQ